MNDLLLSKIYKYARLQKLLMMQNLSLVVLLNPDSSCKNVISRMFHVVDFLWWQLISDVYEIYQKYRWLTSRNLPEV